MRRVPRGYASSRCNRLCCRERCVPPVMPRCSRSCSKTIAPRRSSAYDDTRDGEDVEVALDWNTDKAHWLSRYEAAKNQGLAGNPDQCMEVIHDYQLEHINDCNEAYYNAAYDIVYGYYCKEPQSTYLS